VRRSLLSIVDLAGSERVCKSGTDGLRLEEAKRINKSISALGNVIAALAAGNGRGLAHVPFRDSKLTRLLTDSLGGNTKTVLCASVGPALHNYDETFCSLLLATRAMAVRNHARVNERIERPENAAPERQALLAQMRALQSEVQRLRREQATGPRPTRPPRAPAAGHAPRAPTPPVSLQPAPQLPYAPPPQINSSVDTWAAPQSMATPTTAGVPAHGLPAAEPTSATSYEALRARLAQMFAGDQPARSLQAGAHLCRVPSTEDAAACSAAAAAGCTAALQASARMHVNGAPTGAPPASAQPYDAMLQPFAEPLPEMPSMPPLHAQHSPTTGGGSSVLPTPPPAGASATYTTRHMRDERANGRHAILRSTAPPAHDATAGGHGSARSAAGAGAWEQVVWTAMPC
jgi:hypothetical protein